MPPASPASFPAHLRLDPKSPLPLHAQAELLLRELIRQPEYYCGGLLPNEVALSSSLGISRNTLRAAIGRLVAEGRLNRKSGVGTRVAEPRVHSGVGAWQSFTQEMKAKGIKVETYSVKAAMTPASLEAAHALQIPEGSEVLRVERLRGWDGKPEVFFQSYLHPRLRLSPEDDFSRPLYELIRERSGTAADESVEVLKAINADRALARLLRTTIGTALLCRDRVVLDAGGRPMEYALVHYCCGRFNLTLNLRQNYPSS